MRKAIAMVALVSVVLAAASLHAAARTRTMMCAICGTVIDADPIFYSRDAAPDRGVAGAIIGDGHEGHEPAAGWPAAALIGRDARKSERSEGDERGLRLEIRMDAGGSRIIEVGGGLRVYRRDRVRVHHDRVEVFD